MDEPSTLNESPGMRSGANARFCPTHWSVVFQAAERQDSPQTALALTRLCQEYWPPIYAFIRRQGFAPHQAQDLTQDFFYRLCSKNILRAADPARGKFRSFLLSSVKNFLNNERDKVGALKRGGGAVLISLDETNAEKKYGQLPVAPGLSPEKLFDRQWALMVLEKAHQNLEKEYNDRGKSQEFKELQPFLSGEPMAREYSGISQRLGRSEGAIRIGVFRLRKRLGQLLREEVSQTVAGFAEIEEELNHLRAILCDGE